MPCNRVGRTGLCGRGLLGKWGGNHAADPIVTRYHPDSGKLLAAGASALVTDEKANTALHVAAAAGHVHVCRALLAAGVDWEQNNTASQDAEVMAALHPAGRRLF